MDWVTVAQVITALGIGGILTKLFEGIVAWLQKRKDAEKGVWRKLDEESRIRRMLEEYVHQLRLLLRKHGVEDLPPWPEYNRKE